MWSNYRTGYRRNQCDGNRMLRCIKPVRQAEFTMVSSLRGSDGGDKALPYDDVHPENRKLEG
jgi:hypothetical protein